MNLIKKSPVAVWLAIGVVMLMIQILLGGITRLTGSGLSITEWQPLLGALPPLSTQGWEQSFQKYQQIAQFKQVNSHFSLSDYQHIFFWEWLHRNWARLMGLVFIVPFLYFIIQKKIKKDMIRPLMVLFILGGFQGLIGWVMVQSGLNDTDVRVSHIRLAIHFISALFLLCYLLWFSLKLSVPDSRRIVAPQSTRLQVFLLVLLLIQLVYGAFMAGSHAALHAATWPDMNGSFVPAGLLTSDNLIYRLFYDPLVIQFVHRNLAYVIALLVVVWYFQTGKVQRNSLLHRYRSLPLLLVLLQITLGIFALINSPFKSSIYFSLLHQLTGMLLWMTLVTAYFLSVKSVRSIH